MTQEYITQICECSNQRLPKACTSAITAVAWHEKPTFLAEIEFVTENEWVEELGPLLEDMEDLGNAAIPKQSPELQAAWNKVIGRTI